ncbi:hypothetical protein WIS52_19690 [Pseudonocardia nematodicida]|uniref:Uncharacterized protein n=1 Tax=Pseudonocardia nematodicida TaxID=1206997 RepID=A0ABV1KE10_9PSEU
MKAAALAQPPFPELQRAGYRFDVRHQPAPDTDEEPDWVVVIRTPEGRTLFPDAVDSTETSALRRAADRARLLLRAEPGPVASGPVASRATDA